MSNKNTIFGKIHPTASLISIILIVLCLFIAHSIYLILTISSLVLIVFMFFNIKTIDFVKFLKNRIILLLIFLITYIIIIGEYNYLNILLFFIKLVVTFLIIYIFEFGLDFHLLNEAIYGFLLPIKKTNINQISYDISMSLFIIKLWFDSKEIIKNNQTFLQQRTIGLDKFFSLRTIVLVKEIKKLQLRQKLNKYTLKYNKIDLKSKICILTFILFFIVCIFREVVF